MRGRGEGDGKRQALAASASWVGRSPGRLREGRRGEGRPQGRGGEENGKGRVGKGRTGERSPQGRRGEGRDGKSAGEERLGRGREVYGGGKRKAGEGRAELGSGGRKQRSGGGGRSAQTGNSPRCALRARGRWAGDRRWTGPRVRGAFVARPVARYAPRTASHRFGRLSPVSSASTISSTQNANPKRCRLKPEGSCTTYILHLKNAHSWAPGWLGEWSVVVRISGG